MANTVSTISYANTFGQWMVATDALIAENNILATGDYTKNSGTLYLSETTKNAIQANGSVIVQKELRVQGIASSATIDNNLTVAGQVYFSNTTLGLTNSGQANINGLLVAQGPGLGLSVANNTYIGGNTTIQYNTITNNLQANNSVNTSNASIVGTTYTNKLQANTSVLTGTVQANTSVLTNSLQANTSIVTSIIQSNTSVNTAVASVTGGTYTNTLQANTSIVTGTVQANTSVLTGSIQANTSILTDALQANTSVVTDTIQVNTITANTKLDGNSAAGFLNSLQVQGGGLTVNGNFTLTGTTVYASNTFQLSTSTTSGISSYLQVARGSSGANAAIRWNEPQTYWDMLNVNSNTYYRILTNEYINDTLTSTSTTNVATANVANTLNNQLTAANTFLQAAVVAAGSYANSAFLKANSAYDSQNTTGTYANSAYAQANSASLYANGAFVQANSAYSSQNTTGTYANSAFLKANSAYDLANTFANTFVGTTGSVSQSSGVISFSSNNGVTIFATTANNLAVSTSQDLRTTASPTFASLTLTTPLALSQGGTGTTSAASALTALLPTGTTAGYVLTTGGPGNFYWAAGGGGGGGATPGTSINSTRLSYTANGASGYTGNSFVIPVATSGTQVRAYINGVRQFESEYSLNLNANTITFTTTPPNGDSILIEVDGYYVNPYYANNIAYTINNNISPTANTIQLAIDGLTSKVTTYYANTNANAGTQAFGNIVTGITMQSGTSNTAFATTAYVQNLTNSSGTLTTSITGNAGTVTNGVVTSGSYSDPSWILSLAAAKVGVGTANNVQHNSLGIGTGASGTAGEIRATNNITGYYTSDAKYKENIKPIENALDKAVAIGGKTFDWTDEYIQSRGGEDDYFVRKSDFGVIAQDVQQQFPVAVRTKIEGTLAVDYEKLCALAFQAIAELKAEIDELKEKIK